ncbi:MAG: GldM family protein [Bacteroidales bacterium]
MKRNEKNQVKSKLNYILLISLFILFTAGTINEAKGDEPLAVVSPIKMNVLYLGVNNPVHAAVSGYTSSQLEVTIEEDKGRIIGENGEYIVMPKRTGTLKLNVSADGEFIRSFTFRVKAVTDPVARVAEMSGGRISKNELLAQDEVQAFMPNFDFDLEFRVVAFSVSAAGKDNNYISAESESDKITDEQKAIMNSLALGSRVNFENIRAIGPDGSKRKLAPIVFEIVE